MDGFGETLMVPRIRLIEQTHDYVESIASQREDDPCQVFVPLTKEPLTTFNQDTYIHDLLRVCGGYNVFAEKDERYPEVTMDEVIAAQPHVILLPSEYFGKDDVLHRFGFLTGHGIKVPSLHVNRQDSW